MPTLVVFDLGRKVTVTRELLHQNVDHTPYEGFAVTGWAGARALRQAEGDDAGVNPSR
jgi:dihydropyrimidinase